MNSAFVRGCSKSQKTVALSSAEAEYNSAVACAIDGILIHSMVEFVFPGNVAPLQLLVDSAAARGNARAWGASGTLLRSFYGFSNTLPLAKFALRVRRPTLPT